MRRFFFFFFAVTEWLKIIESSLGKWPKLWARKNLGARKKPNRSGNFFPYSAYLSQVPMQGLEVTGCHKVECELTWNESHQIGLDSYKTVLYYLTTAKLIFLQHFCQSEPSGCRQLAKGIMQWVLFWARNLPTNWYHSSMLCQYVGYICCLLLETFIWLGSVHWDACQKKCQIPERERNMETLYANDSACF